MNFICKEDKLTLSGTYHVRPCAPSCGQEVLHSRELKYLAGFLKVTDMENKVNEQKSEWINE